MKRKRVLGENIFCAIMDEANFMKQWKPEAGEVVLVKIVMYWDPIDPIEIGWTWTPAEVLVPGASRARVKLLGRWPKEQNVRYDDIKRAHPLEVLGSL
jgi:hypothetical protein